MFFPFILTSIPSQRPGSLSQVENWTEQAAKDELVSRLDQSSSLIFSHSWLGLHHEEPHPHAWEHTSKSKLCPQQLQAVTPWYPLGPRSVPTSNLVCSGKMNPRKKSARSYKRTKGHLAREFQDLPRASSSSLGFGWTGPLTLWIPNPERRSTSRVRPYKDLPKCKAQSKGPFAWA